MKHDNAIKELESNMLKIYESQKDITKKTTLMPIKEEN